MFSEGQRVNISSASVLAIKLCCDNVKGTKNVKGKRTCGGGKDQSRDSSELGAYTSAGLGDTQTAWEEWLKLLEALGLSLKLGVDKGPKKCKMGRHLATLRRKVRAVLMNEMGTNNGTISFWTHSISERTDRIMKETLSNHHHFFCYISCFSDMCEVSDIL